MIFRSRVKCLKTVDNDRSEPTTKAKHGDEGMVLEAFETCLILSISADF